MGLFEPTDDRLKKSFSETPFDYFPRVYCLDLFFPGRRGNIGLSLGYGPWHVFLYVLLKHIHCTEATTSVPTHVK